MLQVGLEATTLALERGKTAHVLGHVRFEVSTAVTIKNGVFWDVTQCDSCKNRRFGGTYHLALQGGRNQRSRKNVSSKLLLTAKVVPSSLIFSHSGLRR
jgi:hypothetical protein